MGGGSGSGWDKRRRAGALRISPRAAARRPRIIRDARAIHPQSPNSPRHASASARLPWLSAAAAAPAAAADAALPLSSIAQGSPTAAGRANAACFLRPADRWACMGRRQGVFVFDDPSWQAVRTRCAEGRSGAAAAAASPPPRQCRCRMCALQYLLITTRMHKGFKQRILTHHKVSLTTRHRAKPTHTRTPCQKTIWSLRCSQRASRRI